MASNFSVRPVHKTSLAQGVFDELSGSILHGALAAGQALPPERELAALVEPRQGGGTFVCDYRRRAGLDLLPALLARPGGEFDADVVRSVMEMRSALAPDVARLAAERRSDAQLARLRECLRSLYAVEDTGGDPGAPTAAFWDALVDASDNVAYRLAYNALLTAAAMGGQRLRRLLDVELEPISDFACLLAAIEERDAEGAAALARRIVRKGQHAVLRSLDPTRENA